LIMRLNRGAGVRGLGAMRGEARVPGTQHRLLRPLLSWRRSELEAVCRAAGLSPADDPSNSDDRFERIRVRNALADADWLDPAAIARSAAHLASADAALDWAAEAEWDANVIGSGEHVDYTPSAPVEIRRRIVERAVEALASEGEGNPLRGRELDRLVDTLEAGESATLRGVRCSGGPSWRFEQAPKRRQAR
jgi:tRNA(Ile)-lysidine synthase